MASQEENRVALVTNAREFGGLGSVTALIDAGYQVVCHDKSFADGSSREQFARDYTGSHPYAEQEPEALVQNVLSRYGRIDVLVSNDVIIGGMNPVEKATPDDYRTVIEAGMVWPFTLAHAVVPQMKERGSGALVFITSGAALSPSANLSMYSSARAGAVALSQSLAKELGPFNIQVNAICPNFLRSETYFSEDRLANNPQVRERIRNDVPIGRLGEQDELGALVAFLATQRGMPMTGQAIAFAGGYYP